MTTIRALILPKPITPEWDWQIHALCRQMDTELFYSHDGEERAARARRERAAKEICLGCPVRRACADHAVTAAETYGVWGGTTERDRQTMIPRARRDEARRRRSLRVLPRSRPPGTRMRWESEPSA
ncbi:transcriptional regulator [Rhodococcus sp. ACS1]|uniref:WhiB family transcriptional regulator n=1 Tax=Rhodococcus sp. ACS1 TaxID=2028570 RepID=UPI000BB108BF|nr:WhiB family transcriptional regulator [Rhodococcus sp. ACS1]PBC46203.1 transcriptional regulator [Rhodococcus sp. ACS1]